jgi:hypothetical protein
MNHRRVLAVVAASAALLGPPRGATAGFLSFNSDFVNTTGSLLNDYHVKMVSTAPITISSTWQTGGNVQFNPGTVSGNGTNTVTIDWSGATVNQGQTTHVGASTAAFDPNIKIVESWWTVGGVKFTTTGNQASANFTGGANFAVARISIFNDSLGTTLLGTEWMEGPGNFQNVQNQTTDGPLFVKVALLTSTTVIPLQNLNFSLTGFGADSAVQTLPPVPEPASAVALGVGLLTLAVASARRRSRPF